MGDAENQVAHKFLTDDHLNKVANRSRKKLIVVRMRVRNDNVAIYSPRGFRMVVFVFVLLATQAAVVMVTGLNADGVALLAFKAAIWSDPQNALQTWRSSDVTPCLWKGITCVRIQATMEDRVVSIDLSRRALGGTIAPALGKLRYLAAVNLQFNKLTGQIPKELFKATSSLSRLYLSNNDLTGGIPAEIRNLGQQLRVLEVSGNRLTSALPQEIVACYRLRRLVLSNNSIVGVLPVGMGARFAQLERLDLSVNQFSGSIPDDFGNLTSLLPQTPLNLSSNRLSGSIPPSLANLRSVPIDLRNNELSGSVPSDSYFQSQGPVAYLGNAALCGSPLKVDCPPSPSPSPASVASSSTATTQIGTNSSKEGPPLSKAAVVATAVGSGVAGFMLMASFVLYFIMRKLHLNKSGLQTAKNSGAQLRGCLCSWRGNHGSMDEGGDLVHLSGVFSFNLEELLRASAYVLGKSGVGGIVYKAVLDELGTVVAVRRLGEGGEQKRKEFESEVKSIAQLRHPHVVGLHSYLWTPDEKLLVYDYLPHGSLETALHGRLEGLKGTLTWDARSRIARGAAQGIVHIHKCSPRKLVHGDIKATNILLDVFLEARIANFGLQRLLSLMVEPEIINGMAIKATQGDSGRRTSSVVPAPEIGSLSFMSLAPGHRGAPFLTGVYQAPEAATSTKRPTQKSDVYSFGVVLLELLTGRSPFQQMAAGQLDLVSWTRLALQQKNALCAVFDPVLQLDANHDAQTQMIETLQVALACIAVNPDSRPKMKQVAKLLEQIQAKTS